MHASIATLRGRASVPPEALIVTVWECAPALLVVIPAVVFVPPLATALNDPELAPAKFMLVEWV